MTNEILGMIMIGVMLFAIFIGFPISFTLIFLGAVFGFLRLWKSGFLSNDIPIFIGNAGTNTSRRSTLHFHGDSHGKSGVNGKVV